MLGIAVFTAGAVNWQEMVPAYACEMSAMMRHSARNFLSIAMTLWDVEADIQIEANWLGTDYVFS